MVKVIYLWKTMMFKDDLIEEITEEIDYVISVRNNLMAIYENQLLIKI